MNFSHTHNFMITCFEACKLLFSQLSLNHSLSHTLPALSPYPSPHTRLHAKLLLPTKDSIMARPHTFAPSRSPHVTPSLARTCSLPTIAACLSKKRHTPSTRSRTTEIQSELSSPRDAHEPFPPPPHIATGRLWHAQEAQTLSSYATDTPSTTVGVTLILAATKSPE